MNEIALKNDFKYGISNDINSNDISVLKSYKAKDTLLKYSQNSINKQSLSERVVMILEAVFRIGGIWTKDVDFEAFGNDTVRECKKHKWLTFQDLKVLLERGALAKYGEYKTYSQRELIKWIEAYRTEKGKIINKQLLREEKEIFLLDDKKKEREYEELKKQSIEKFRTEIEKYIGAETHKEIPQELDFGGVWFDRLKSNGHEVDYEERKRIWNDMKTKCFEHYGDLGPGVLEIKFKRALFQKVIFNLIQENLLFKVIDEIGGCK